MRRGSRGRVERVHGLTGWRARLGLFAVAALGLVLLGAASAQPAHATGTSFVSTWQTANTSAGSSSANRIRLPLVSGGVYNFTVDWGDGSSSTITAHDQAEVTHTYATPGVKTITIIGTVNGWRFGGTGDRMKLLDISEWGPLRLGNDGGYFWGAGNLQISATDQPDLTGTTNLSSMFLNATALTGSTLSGWDITGVTDLSRMFLGASAFNGDISSWNTSAVTTMASMFDGATAFNQDLSAWDFDQVTRFGSFLRNTAFGILNYNRLLARLASQDVQPDLGTGTTTADRTIDVAPARYSIGTAATNRAELIGRGFTVTDGGSTNQNVPDAPTGVVIWSDSGTSATIRWVAPNANNSPITGYTVTAYLRADTAMTVTCMASTTECEFSGTLAGGVADWLFRVTATNAVGTSAPSDVDPPDTPASPSVVPGNGAVTVTITPPATGGKPATYSVQATTDGGSDVAGKVCTITMPATACTVSGLANGTIYRFKASAENWIGDSGFSGLSSATTPGPVFAATWLTSTTSAGSSGANQVRLPLEPPANGGSYDFYVSWGDGTTDRITAHDQAEATHTYAIAGTKEITITGTITGWRFNNLGDRLKLTQVTSWGPLRLGDNGGYFYGAANMVVTATDPLDLTGTTSLFNAFHGAAQFDGDVGGWTTTGVTDLTNAFHGATAFTGTGLGAWDVSGVTDMYGAFQDSGMNADISSWDVSRVTDMHRTFAGATAFNRAIGSWDVRAVQDMEGIFAGATSFNQDLSTWNTAAVTDLSDAFRDSGFGGEIATWDVDRVTDFSNLFRNTAGIPTGAAGVGWYNRLLIGWSAQDVRDNTGGSAVVLTACGRSDADGAGCAAGALQYSAGAAQRARQRLVDRGWVIADGGQGAVGVPARVSGVTSTPGSTAVAWSAPADNGSAILSYAVTAIERSNPAATTMCVATTTNLYADCGLDAADYHFTVTATNAVGTSESSFYVRPAAPAAPVVVPGSASAQVVVAAVADAETYTVHAAPAGGGPDVDTCTFAAPATSCLIDALDNDADYRFRAVATNAVGVSDASTTTLATPSANRFTSTWETTRTSNGSTGWKQVRLPLPVGEPGDYSFVVTWGDGSMDVVTSHDDPDATHTYATAGTKHISITGTLGGWRFAGSGDRLKLAEISRWGGIRLGNAGGYFDGAEHLTLTAADAPDLTGTADLSYAFRNATALVDGLASWDVGGVTTMRGMFQGATSFNGLVATWNVANVTNMSGMFHGAAGFNGNVSSWNVGNVTDMSNLFRGSGFTGEVAAWDVASVTTMDGMFRGIPAMSGTPFINWYNRLLIGWATQSVQPNVSLNVCGSVNEAVCPGGVQYHGAAAASARTTLVTDQGWTINDGGVAAANVPDAPGGVAYVRNGTTLTVSWTAPSANGSAITGYRVVADPSGNHCDSATTSCTITGLSPDEGERYSVTITATNALGTSDASAPYSILRPGPPGTPTVVGGSAAATVTVPASTTGGAPSRYVVTASPGGATCAITDLSGPLQCTVTGLANGTAYTFTVAATNNAGSSSASAASSSVTPRSTPGQPSVASVAAGDQSAVVSWTAPGSDGGAAITAYTVTSSGGQTCGWTTGALQCTVAGLTNGTAYTFTVVATNALGTGSASAPSGAVTPSAPAQAPTEPSSAAAPIAAGASTAGRTPPPPRRVAWASPRGGKPMTATFKAEAGTTYSIRATLKKTAVRGRCSAKLGSVTCTIALKAKGPWVVAITPSRGGVAGVPASKVVRV